MIVFEKLCFTEWRWLFFGGSGAFLSDCLTVLLLVTVVAFLYYAVKIRFLCRQFMGGEEEAFLIQPCSLSGSYKNRRNSGIVLSVGFCAVLLNIVLSDALSKNNVTVSCSIQAACSLLTLIFVFHLQVSWSGDTWQNFFGQCGIWSHEGETRGGRQNCRFVLVPAFVVCQWDKQMH